MSIDMKAVSPTRTICEVLREINDYASILGFTEIQNLVLEATTMAKKMSAKLCEYKEQAEVYKDLDAAPNPNYEKSRKRRKID